MQMKITENKFSSLLMKKKRHLIYLYLNYQLLNYYSQHFQINYNQSNLTVELPYGKISITKAERWISIK